MGEYNGAENTWDADAELPEDDDCHAPSLDLVYQLMDELQHAREEDFDTNQKRADWLDKKAALLHKKLEAGDRWIAERRRLLEARQKASSDDDLFRDALSSSDFDVSFGAVEVLWARAGDEVFARACALCVSTDPHERKIGADIIGMIGLTDEMMGGPYHEETVTLLLAMLEHETDPETIFAICQSFDHRRDLRAVAPLLRFRQHPDERVRRGVAYAMRGHANPDAIATLIELTDDPEDRVSEAATFALALGCDLDTPELRDALVAKLNDYSEQARCDAMLGLADRHDERVFIPIRTALEENPRFLPNMQAAMALSDPRLLETLLFIQETTDQSNEIWANLIQRAIESCQPKTDSPDEGGA